ncbi:S4 domain-containing protein [Flavobacteriaceae bacterium]|jgi:23S rRNA pseudouridine2605 synthase|nr:S4 domain-containing protein [Flavobacteriaceae bacterium]
MAKNETSKSGSQSSKGPRSQGPSGAKKPFKKPSNFRPDRIKKSITSPAAKSNAPKKEGIRLNKYVANSGVCSRREADTYIASGLVTVNNKVVNVMGYLVKPGEEVKFDGRRLQPDPPTYVLLNKPKSVASTNSESKGLTVMDLIANASTANLKPVGRLGRNATGLFLFTNDDQLMNKLHKKGMPRLFHIELDKNLKAADLQKIKEGFALGERTIQVEDVSYVANKPKKEIGLKIKNLGNSVIREMFEHLGYQVVKVDCVTLAHLTKKDLPRGRWRTLTTEEIDLFSML